MLLKPEWLFVPEYVADEIRDCRARVEAGLYETGLIVDANNLMYRLAFAASKDINGPEDLLAMFVERVAEVGRSLQADIVVCGIDHGVSLRRSLLGAKRKPGKTPEQQAVVDMAREALKAMRESLPCQHIWLNPLFLEGYEADDICAAVAVSGLCVHTVLYSTDSDLYQVTDGRGVTQLSPASGSFLVSEVPQALVPGVKALAGDGSDNVEGIRGIGPKTALDILTGKKTRDLEPDEVRRVRHNLTLTCLPFPGSFQCLEVMNVHPFDKQVGQSAETDEGDGECLPF